MVQSREFNYAIMNDAELIEHYKLGKERALTFLIDRNEQLIYSFIFSKVKNQELAEDVYQETFVRVIKKLKLGAYIEKGKFVSWVFRIANNLIIDYHRHKKKMPMVGQSKKDEDYDVFSFIDCKEDSVEDVIINKQIKEDLREIIEFLPDNQKEILMLRMYKGMAFKDIAEKLDISMNTALGRMRYAVLKLRKIVKEKNISLTN